MICVLYSRLKCHHPKLDFKHLFHFKLFVIFLLSLFFFQPSSLIQIYWCKQSSRSSYLSWSYRKVDLEKAPKRYTLSSWWMLCAYLHCTASLRDIGTCGEPLSPISCVTFINFSHLDKASTPLSVSDLCFLIYILPAIYPVKFFKLSFHIIRQRNFSCHFLILSINIIILLPFS